MLRDFEVPVVGWGRMACLKNLLEVDVFVFNNSVADNHYYTYNGKAGMMDMFHTKEGRGLADKRRKAFTILHSEFGNICRILGIIGMAYPMFTGNLDIGMESMEISIVWKEIHAALILIPEVSIRNRF
jgi:hypothetical protein